ncbi:MAG: type II toxin-antitoxin system MqsR family toxin [Erysipelotrichaceae bacterium]|nr:type II toxin-antitoxin system MqsR family toxin [Erysipelotrichaceae bacterium]
MTGSTELEIFLNKAKSLLLAGKYDFIPRKKNMLSLARNGMTVIDALMVLESVSVDDYYKGPKQDFDATRPGEIWEFKKAINRNVFYIKLKIAADDGEEVLKCIGFHEDEFSGSRGEENDQVL